MANLFKKSKNDHYDVSAVLVAAGLAERMQGVDKQFAVLDGIPVVIRSVLAFENCPDIGEIILVLREDQIPPMQQMLTDFGIMKVKTVVAGGNTRQNSVYKGFCETSEEFAYLLIHDGARPFITPQEISLCVQAARECGGAVLGTRMKDTMKMADSNGFVEKTIPRERVFAVQTPQIFKKELYRIAMQKAQNEQQDYTDDCQLFEAAGYPVKIVEGSARNIKITVREDLLLAQALLSIEEDDYVPDWPWI